MIKGVAHAHLGPIIYVSLETFRCPFIHQTSFLVGTFCFAVSYSKSALIDGVSYKSVLKGDSTLVNYTTHLQLPKNFAMKIVL